MGTFKLREVIFNKHDIRSGQGLGHIHRELNVLVVLKGGGWGI